ncbi:MAG: hypothetical protein HYX97_04095 [Chloroflexi bacterium]|nr:hypothetical protein [Chloroflexota bacterium]
MSAGEIVGVVLGGISLLLMLVALYLIRNVYTLVKREPRQKPENPGKR